MLAPESKSREISGEKSRWLQREFEQLVVVIVNLIQWRSQKKNSGEAKGGVASEDAKNDELRC